MANEFEKLDQLLANKLPVAETKNESVLRKELDEIYSLAEKSDDQNSLFKGLFKVAAAIMVAAISFFSLYQLSGTNSDDFPGANTGGYTLVADYGDTLILYDDEIRDTGNYEANYDMLSEIVYVDSPIGGGR